MAMDEAGREDVLSENDMSQDGLDEAESTGIEASDEVEATDVEVAEEEKSETTLLPGGPEKEDGSVVGQAAAEHSESNDTSAPHDGEGLQEQQKTLETTPIPNKATDIIDEPLDHDGNVHGGRSTSKLPKKMVVVAAAMLGLVGILFGTHVICFHSWAEATCESPKTCTICGRTQGDPLGHAWADATCEDPQTCTRCGKTTGKALGHEWEAATCTTPETCTICGKTTGEPLGHDYVGLTCTTEGKCSRCGEVVPAKGHDWKEASCTTPKTCAVCGATEGEPLGHTTTSGVCSRCGAEFYETYYGSGDDVVSNVSVGDEIYRVHFVNSGSRNFAVWLYDADGDKDLLINEIGEYDGRVLLMGSAPYTFQVTSSGDWSYTIEQVGVTEETEFHGTGDYVTDLFYLTSGAWEFKHDGEHNFVVHVYSADGRDLLVNDIGPYDGKQYINVSGATYAFFEITADGNWSAKPVD